MKSSRIILLVSLFAVAFAFVESSVVVYLRLLYYPEGFAFPLKPALMSQMIVELSREFATIVMLLVIGWLAGRTRWQRFSYFVIAFGVWDIFYYVWLKLILNWPVSLFDWDILFLIPVPWIGPVVAPVLVSIVMIAGGMLILSKEEASEKFRASKAAIILSLAGSILVISSFVLDPGASLRFQEPQPYRYELLALSMVCYAAAFILTSRSLPHRPK
jgi:hypothetical protein